MRPLIADAFTGPAFKGNPAAVLPAGRSHCRRVGAVRGPGTRPVRDAFLTQRRPLTSCIRCTATEPVEFRTMAEPEP